MPLYESVFIARQDISAPQVEALADTFAKIIEDQGGTVAKREHWGLRGLAYRIKKNRKGHYVLFNLDAPSDAIQEMERQMTIHEDVLRYLTLRMDELDPEPSVIMQRGAARDDRDRGRPRRHGADAPPPRDSRDAGRGSAGKPDAAPAKAPAKAPTEAKDDAAGKTDGDKAPAKAPAKAKDDAAGKTDGDKASAKAPAEAKDEAGKTDGDKAEGDKTEGDKK